MIDTEELSINKKINKKYNYFIQYFIFCFEEIVLKMVNFEGAS